MENSINPATPLSSLEEIIYYVDFVLLMSVNYMVELTKEKDPEEVVIDEVVGYFFYILLFCAIISVS